MPKGQQYTFHYDPVWGLVNEVDYPDGGWVKYTWKLSDTTSEVATFNGEDYDNLQIPPYVGACTYQYRTPVVATRTVGFSSGSSAAQTQTFSYQTTWNQQDGRYWTVKSTIVVATDNITNKSQTTNYAYYPINQTAQPNSIGQLTPQLAVENSVTTYDWNGSLLNTVNETWLDPSLLGQKQTVLPNGLSSEVSTQYLSPFPGVPVEEDEYDFGTTPSLNRKTLYSYYDFNLPNQIITKDANGNRLAETDAYYDGQTSLGAATSGSSAPTQSATTPTYTLNGTTYPTHDETNFGPSSTQPRGNPTTILRWLNTGSSITTTHTYDETGQVLSTTDGCGNTSCGDVSGTNHTTTYSYNDSSANGGSANLNGNSNAYVTLITDPLGHTQKFSWNYGTGQLASATDQNNQPTYYKYNDSLLRLTETDYPTGGGTTSVCYYDPGATVQSNCPGSVPTITTTRTAAPNPSIVTVSKLDGMSHVTDEGVSSDGTNVHTDYTGMGAVSEVSNPYRTESPVYTRFAYDALGRKLTQINPDNSAQYWCYDGVNSGQKSCPAASSKTGHWVDSWDEAGVHHQRVTDGLGRLVAVMEPNRASGAAAVETDYSYDGLDNLTGVLQKGDTSGSPDANMPENPRSRSFSYDSLSRLLTAYNPESSWTCYGTVPSGQSPNASNCTSGYDANGNLGYKTTSQPDNNGNAMQITYGYDVLNRLTYKGALTDVDNLQGYLSYDQGTYGVGRLTSESRNGVAGEGYGYDPMGRVISTSFHDYMSNSNVTGMQASYNEAGSLNTLTYPDGRQIKHTWDGGGHLQTITDVNTSQAYFTALTSPSAAPSGFQGYNGAYWPSGALANAQLGSFFSESLALNNRLQPTGTVVGTSLLAGSAVANLVNKQIFYTSNTTSPAPCAAQATQNNGNVYSTIDSLQAGMTQVFSYDQLNRLNCATNPTPSVLGQYSHTYNHDSFGNMHVIDQIQGDMGDTIDPATNRLYFHGGYVNYDGAGDIVEVDNPVNPPNRTLSYTSEGYLRCIDGCSTGSYLYDAIGHRSYASRPSSATDYVYLNDQPMAEYTNTGYWADYIYANGRKIAQVRSASPAIHVHGNDCSTCQSGWVNTTISSPIAGYQIQSGDKLFLLQKQVNIQAGFQLNTQQGGSTYPNSVDQTGNNLNQSGAPSGVWESRIVDLSSFNGQIVSNVCATLTTSPPPGAVWDVYYRDITIVSSDGTVHPIFNDGMSPGLSQAGPAGEANLTASVDLVDTSADPAGTHYYLGDHLGTTQLEVSSGGWPVWEGQFTPFGQEIVNGGTLNALGPQPHDGSALRYKFTGKERDTESGLDYFGARYYSSVIGRFSSPDWSASPEAVPYSHLDNPQSLNLYTYVLNNPLSKPDLDGHGCPPDCSTGNQVIDFFGGVANAFGSDNLAGAGRVNIPSTGGQLGQMVGDLGATLQGAAQVIVGTGGNIAGAALDATGVGAVVGVPANVVSTAVTVEGAGAATMGSINLFKAGGNFSSGTKQDAKAAAGGKCQNCGVETTPGQQSQKGVTPPGTEGQTDHIQPKSKGGTNDPSNAQHLCRDCNIKKSDKMPNQ